MSIDMLLKSHLKTLKLPTILQEYARAARQCAQENRSFEDFLHYLVELEVAQRQRKACLRRLKEAGFPTEKELADFDFVALPSLNKKRILDLGQGHFIPQREGIVFLGPPGVGKTHLAIAMGMKAAQTQKRVLFYTAENLIEELIAAEVSGKLTAFLDIMGRIDLLIIDELGYLKMTRQAAELFFKLIAKRYEKGAVIVTTNKAFEQWGEIFTDEVVAAAILDRLLHHSFPFFIQGKSYRMKNITGD